MKSVPRRIAIIGLPGSGKSTFAAQLSIVLNVPVYHLDKYMFSADGTKIDKVAFISLLNQFLTTDSWIIEGCSFSTFEARFARADTIIYFNLPRMVCIWRIFLRAFFPNKQLNDLAEGARQPIDRRMIHYIWNFDAEKGPTIRLLAKKYPHLDFRVFTGDQDTASYFEEITAGTTK